MPQIRTDMFDFWVAACGLDPTRHTARRAMITPECGRALHHWRAPSLLTQGIYGHRPVQYHERQPDRLG